ncbi:DNA recombination/repair protein RecA, partial [Rhizobium leguminosarum]|nr:DNA recombination/repair protein RecA [Rhizobium leguminosarum]
PDLANEIEERILTKLGIGVAPEAEDDEAPALTAVPGDTAVG